MKPIRLLILAMALGLGSVAYQGCGTPPSARVVQVQSLKAVGHTAEAAVATSAQLYNGHVITGQQARAVIDLYNIRFQPAFRVAVSAVNANLDSIASPELADLAGQLASLVASYQKP